MSLIGTAMDAGPNPAGWTEAETEHGPGCVRPRPVAFVRGEGARLFTEAGDAYIDVSASYGVASVGHARTEVVKAVAEQSARLGALTLGFTNDVRAGYLRALTEQLPGDLDRVFLCNSGAESAEAALKIARLHAGRPGVLALSRGFHGRTMGALALTAKPGYRAPFAPLDPGVRHVPFGRVEALREAWDPSIGAVMVEVIQGEGGVHVAPPGYLAEVRALCDEHDALLLVDEVQTGFGRTGALFAVDHEGVVPDVLCLGKGIAGGFPMGAAAFGPRVGPLPPGSHGSTFGGSPLACAAAHATLRVLLEEDLPARAAALGSHALQRLTPHVGAGIRSVRGRGLMIGVELRTAAAPVLQELLARRIVALGAGRNVVRLLPPLVIDEDDWDTVLDTLLEVIA